MQGTRDISELSLTLSSPNPRAGASSRALDQEKARLFFVLASR
jgi:hypothetical protein